MRILHVTSQTVRSTALWMSLGTWVDWDIVEESEFLQLNISEYDTIVYDESVCSSFLDLLDDPSISRRIDSKQSQFLIVSSSPKIRHMGFKACLLGQEFQALKTLLIQ